MAKPAQRAITKAARRLFCTAFALCFVGAGLSAPIAGADPAAEQQYLTSLHQFVHPSVTTSRLIELGNLTCVVRRNGSSTDDAKNAVWQSLDRQGVVSSNAEIGTLVHEAVNYLCPDVGYP